MPHHQYDQMTAGEYQVYIESSLQPGAITYGELLIPGATSDEFLLTTHICHPSLANDNLSGMSVLIYLAQLLSARRHRYSYRLLFIPGTIGSIAWLASNESQLSRIKGGLVTSLLGDAGPLHYKHTPKGNAPIDSVVKLALTEMTAEHRELDFTPYGYDERQFCSPGINLDMGCLTRSPYGSFPEYHTSADNLDFIKAEQLAESLSALSRIVEVWDQNRTYINTSPKCEPQLGRRGLYEAMGGASDRDALQMAILWMLHQSSGQMDIVGIARRSGIPFDLLVKACDLLTRSGLLTSPS